MLRSMNDPASVHAKRSTEAYASIAHQNQFGKMLHANLAARLDFDD
jgi:hypothetical protein